MEGKFSYMYTATASFRWKLWVGCVTWRDVTLGHASSKPFYYRVPPDTTIEKCDDLQESLESPESPESPAISAICTIRTTKF
eukprot:32779-Amorphochlora_amoeboformis.AAC.1